MPTRTPSRVKAKSSHALKAQQSLFNVALEDVSSVGKLNPKEQNINQAAYNRRYGDTGLEASFYHYGGFTGILGLVLFFRKFQKIQTNWNAMLEEHKKELVEMVIAKVTTIVDQAFVQTVTKICAAKHIRHLQYVGTHAGRRHQKVALKHSHDWNQHSQTRIGPTPWTCLILSIPEQLFCTIKLYFEMSCRTMNFDEDEALVTEYGVKLHNDLCDEFDSYYFNATMLAKKGMHTESHHALSKATALVERILQAEHPRTLACFLEVLMHLIQTGNNALAYKLSIFIKRMSAKFARNRYPWDQICQFLGDLEMESQYQALAQI